MDDSPRYIYVCVCAHTTHTCPNPLAHSGQPMNSGRSQVLAVIAPAL